MIRLLLAALSLTSACAAQEVKLLALDGALGDGVPALVERFTGETATITAFFLRPPNAALQLTADVYLDGDRLAAPMARSIPFLRAESGNPALLSGSFSLPKPGKEKPLLQLVKVHCLPSNGGAEESFSFRLRWISSAACREALARVLGNETRSGSYRLWLFGQIAGLREQLQQWKVPFEDLGVEGPVRIETHCLAIGDSLPDGAPIPALDDGASLLLLHYAPTAAPEVWRKDFLHSRLTRITLRGVTDWRHSPFLIRALTEHLTLTPP